MSGGEPIETPETPAAPTTPEEPTGATEVPTFVSPASVGYRNPLGTTNIPTVIGRVVRTAIGIMGALFLAAFIYGGIQWMTAGGEADRVKKARTTLTNALIGLLIVGFSYTILATLFGALGGLG